MRAAAVVVVGALGCGSDQVTATPSLGSFRDLAAWQRECSTPLIDEKTCGLLPYTAECSDQSAPFADPPVKFGSVPTATRTIRCAPPGWSLFVDSRDRVVAFCVDDLLKGSDTQGHYEIAHRLATKHLGEGVATALMKHDERRGWSSWVYSTGTSYRPDGRHIFDPRFAIDFGQTRCWGIELKNSGK